MIVTHGYRKALQCPFRQGKVDEWRDVLTGESGVMTLNEWNFCTARLEQLRAQRLQGDRAEQEALLTAAQGMADARSGSDEQARGRGRGRGRGRKWAKRARAAESPPPPEEPAAAQASGTRGSQFSKMLLWFFYQSLSWV